MSNDIVRRRSNCYSAGPCSSSLVNVSKYGGFVQDDSVPTRGSMRQKMVAGATQVLARRGLGNTWPNPAVGCVIIRDGVVVGRGWTQPGGRPHAEVMALAQAGAAARGATAYVTLEPCAHHGKTPPCAEALVRAGIACVVSALTDPDPRVAGRGHAILRAAGVEVREGLRADMARELQQGFLSRITRGRPMLTLKLANSFDGRIATASGESQWITGPAARRAAHAGREASTPARNAGTGKV